ncbi:MAG TPA: TonB-dependent receptor [Hyphomonadaceae bacterium]|nr:TonB-dependent receptor [Hyphomonadaceae bacterium]
MFRINFLGFALTSASVIAITASAAAQQPATPAQPQRESQQASDVIVVTAQKREENIQDVPISITVANQAQLERQQVNTLTDLTRIAPSLEINNSPGQDSGGGGQIRGIGTQSFQQGAVGSVGVVVDQVSQGNTNISNLFDLARVEVLKGPQGTLFGLTTSAGVINMVTNAPEFDRFSARLRTELAYDGAVGSDFGQQVYQGLINVPFSDNAALRVSANVNQRQGVDRNTITGDLDEHDSYSLRGRFLWEPSDNLTVNVIGDYSQSEGDGPDFFVVFKATDNALPPAGPPGSPPRPSLEDFLAACGIVASEDNRNYCTDRTSSLHDESKSSGLSAQVDYDLGDFVLTSITAGRKVDSGPSFLNIFRLDQSNPAIHTYDSGIVGGPTNGETNLITQEFRITSASGSPVEYTAGLFYSNQNETRPPSPFNVYAKVPFPPFEINPVSNTGNNVDIGDFSAAVFGQATFNVNEQLRLIAGARYTQETLKVSTATPTNTFSRVARTEINNTSWRAGVQYDVTPDLMTYATVAKGYKGPQIAIGNPTNPLSVPQVIEPEIPTSYEIGLKNTLFNGLLFTDANVFYSEIENYQGQLCTPNVPPPGLTCIPQNINGVVSKGAEINIFGRPMDHLTLTSGLIYNRAEYPGGFLGQDGSNLAGEQLISAPEWKFTLGGEYEQPLTAGMTGFVAADTVYKSEIRFAASTDPNVTYDAHWILGGRIGVRSEDGAWTAALFGRNLTNEHEPILRFQNFPEGAGNYGQILTAQSFRLVGVSLDYKF